MTATTKLGAYALGLVAIFGIGFGVGTAIGPEPAPVTVVEHPPAHDGAHS